MQHENEPGRPGAPKILPAVFAAFAGAILAIACERPDGRLARADGDAADGTQAPRQAAPPAPNPPAETLPPRAQMPPPEAITDPAITQRIEAGLSADSRMAGADVSINTDDGVVTLTGTVKSHEQAAVASAHAQGQDGVMRVDNQLAVQVK